MPASPVTTVATALDLTAGHDLFAETPVAGVTQGSHSYDITDGLSDEVWFKLDLHTGLALSSVDIGVNTEEPNGVNADVYNYPDSPNPTSVADLTFLYTVNTVFNGFGTLGGLEYDPGGTPSSGNFTGRYLYIRLYNGSSAATLANSINWEYYANEPAWTEIDSSTQFAAGIVPSAANILSLPLLDFENTCTYSQGLTKQLPAGATDSDFPINFNIQTAAHLVVVPPPLDITEIEALQRRILPKVVVSLPEPVVVHGRPTLPLVVATMDSAVDVIEGPAHIRVIPNPDPVWNPATSGWYEPAVVPSAGIGDARWTVNSLPNPNNYRAGYYWLGDPSAQDGTVGIAAGCRQWGPDPATPHAASWHSIFPFKPSVRDYVHYGSHGQTTITRGVRFNLQFVEHMWMDFGHNVVQPFTWVIAAIVMDFPSSNYVHTILDSGRDPRAVGYPYLSDSNVPYSSVINDGLNYRNMLQTNINSMVMGTELSPTGGHRIVTPFNMVARPRMFFGVFNGANSYVGNYSTDGKHLTKGRLASTGDHRFYVLGRHHGNIGINYASHLIVFEMRVWHRALTLAELESQYGQLASTWKFNQY